MSAATLAGRGAARGSGRFLAPATRQALAPRHARGVLVLIAAGYHFWLRDSSLVAVDRVEVTGLTTKDAARVRAALASAAHTMTTLHVRHDVLEQAIAAYPVVKALDVRPDFPHGLRSR